MATTPLKTPEEFERHAAERAKMRKQGAILRSPDYGKGATKDQQQGHLTHE